MDSKQERLLHKLKLELGPAIMAALADDRVIEIMLNPDGKIWVESMGEPMKAVGEMSAVNAEALLGTIADALKTEVNSRQPILEGELPIKACRFEGLLPPIVPRPTFTIRKPAIAVFSLDNYVNQGIMHPQQRHFLMKAVKNHKNILVSGGTGSGKTTLTNGLIHQISTTYPDERLVIIEDTAEIQTSAKNAVLLHTSSEVTMQDLLRATMRLRPDRILVGEVRGSEALALLKAWNTGHSGGVATVHANNAAGALIRLEQLTSEAVTGGMPMKPLIAEAIDIVIQIERDGRSRRISEIVSVDGLDGNDRYHIKKFQIYEDK